MRSLQALGTITREQILVQVLGVSRADIRRGRGRKINEVVHLVTPKRSEWVAYLSHSQGMQELANMLLGSASGNTSASEDPFVSGNGDPSSSENPNDEDRGTGNGGDLWA
ncbi:hypothetical protein Tco_1477498 [Tanacetum coccineum]